MSQFFSYFYEIAVEGNFIVIYNTYIPKRTHVHFFKNRHHLFTDKPAKIHTGFMQCLSTTEKDK